MVVEGCYIRQVQRRQYNYIQQTSQGLFSSFGDKAVGVNLEKPQIS